MTSPNPQATPAQPRDQPWRPDLGERPLASQELSEDLVPGQGDSIPDPSPASPGEGGRIPGPGTLQQSLRYRTQQRPLTFSCVQAAETGLRFPAVRDRTVASSRWRVPTTRRSSPPAISARVCGRGFPGPPAVTSPGTRASRPAFSLLHPWIDSVCLPVASCGLPLSKHKPAALFS